MGNTIINVILNLWLNELEPTGKINNKMIMNTNKFLSFSLILNLYNNSYTEKIINTGIIIEDKIFTLILSNDMPYTSIHWGSVTDKKIVTKKIAI